MSTAGKAEVETGSVRDPASGPRPERRHFKALDSLRGICALMVAAYHFETPGFISNLAIVRNGPLFVDFFFVLSGFVMSQSYSEKLASGFPVPSFMALRWGRIFPLHLFMLLVFLAFETMFLIAGRGHADRLPFGDTDPPVMFVASLFLVQIFVGPDRSSWNMPSWSIAAEFWTYLIFAVILRFLTRWALPLFAIIVLTAPILVLAATPDRYINVFHDGALARCLFGFGLGVLGHAISARLPARATVRDAVLEVAACVGTVLFLCACAGGPWTMAAPLIFLCVILTIAREAGPFSRLLLQRPLLLLGTLSYSIYMIHLFIELRVINLLSAISRVTHAHVELVRQIAGHNLVGGSARFGDAMTIITLILIIVCAAVTYRLIERPGQTLSRRLVLGDDRPLLRRSEREAPTF